MFAKIRLIPLKGNEVDFVGDGVLGRNEAENQEKPASFAKTLTQSDANNGGGFSVPRYCADTIFPRLDYSTDPPVQTILAKDVHGEVWKFRHIYRGTPRRHLLTTGWSTFVNQKKLVAGDSIVFLRVENGDLCVGIRRAKKGLGGGVGWSPPSGNSTMSYGGLSSFLREGDNGLIGQGRVKAESVIEAATCAANGEPFEVVFYPRASTPEFFVKSTLVKAAMQVRWNSGMRFKMAFETEDSSRISWFMGTISSVQVADPVLWPDSPWKLLQVTWDEPDLLRNVRRVNPWLVEFVSNVPSVHFSPFAQPLKKIRLQHPEFSIERQLHLPALSGEHLLGASSPFGCLPDNNPAGMQGARHTQYGLSLSNIHFQKLHPNLFPVGLQSFEHSNILSRQHSGIPIFHKPNGCESVSCLLTIGTSSESPKNFVKDKPPQFVLFGQPIVTEQQTSLSSSSVAVSSVCAGNSSSDGNVDKMENAPDVSGSTRNLVTECLPCEESDPLETGHCKVFMVSDDVGRTLDLLSLGSYEEMYAKLASMFGIGTSEVKNHLLYRDVTGSVRQLGGEPWSDFTKVARRLTILTESSSEV